MSDNVFYKLNELNSILIEMDDRGLALTLAAFAEESLGGALSAYMLKNKSGAKLLEGFNAPLGTFSSRIQATHALGIITEDQYQDIEHLRKIRNHFSHTWKPVSLDCTPISDHIDDMCYSFFDDTYPATRRDKLRSSASSLLLEIQVATNQINQKRIGAKIIGSRVMTFAPGETQEATEKCIQHIEAIKQDISRTYGKEREFHIRVKERWVDKLELVEALAPAKKRPDVHALVQKFRLEQD